MKTKQENITYKKAKRSALSQHVTARLQETDITVWQRQTQITKKYSQNTTQYHHFIFTQVITWHMRKCTYNIQGGSRLEITKSKKNAQRKRQGSVSHFSYAPLFQRPHFWQKCWNRAFSMIISLLTFYLFDDFEKNIGISHANHSATSRAILTKCTCNLNVYFFYLCFALGIIHGDHCDRKTPKTIIWFK